MNHLLAGTHGKLGKERVAPGSCVLAEQSVILGLEDTFANACGARDHRIGDSLSLVVLVGG